MEFEGREGVVKVIHTVYLCIRFSKVSVKKEFEFYDPEFTVHIVLNIAIKFLLLSKVNSTFYKNF